MPFTLGPLSRRGFLKTAAVAGATLALDRWTFAADSEPGDALPRVALISDTHIAADPDAMHRDQTMAQNLQTVVRRIIAAPADSRPATIFIDGDLAFLEGRSGDYTTFFKLIQPLREAGMTVHLTLGNHDHRQHFLKALHGSDAPIKPLVPDHYVGIVPVGDMRWFLLDSLNKTNVTLGVLGEAQIKWLDDALTKHADHPAVIILHHNTDVNGNTGQLADCAALYRMIQSHTNVKAIFFGHTHVWRQGKLGDIHLINLPATAYFFGKNDPLGWIEAVISGRSIDLTLHAINHHPSNGDHVSLTW